MLKNTQVKYLFLFISFVVSAIFLILICRLQGQMFDNDYLMNYTFLIAIVSAAIGCVFYGLKYKDKFEISIIFLCLLFFNLLVIYIFPLTINRSLSTFVYFYAVENGKIDKNIYTENYFKDFSNRRIADGERFGFLSCGSEICKPTLNGKIFYYVLYPIGKITLSTKHYEKFKDNIKNIKIKQN